MAPSRNGSLLSEPTEPFILASLLTTLILLVAWAMVDLERRGEVSQRGADDAGQASWSPTTLAAAAVVPNSDHAARTPTFSFQLRQAANHQNRRELILESGVPDVLRSRLESNQLTSQRFQTVLLQSLAALHDTPR